MKNYKFCQYLFADTVSWLLLLATIGMLIWHFAGGQDVSKFLALAILNMFYNIFEKARFFKKLDDTINDPIERTKLGLRISKSGKF